jgi:hypothetical protein
VKKAVSVSLGSTSRNKTVEFELLGTQVRLERIGTDGDEKKAKDLFRQLDGQVDAFGVGGIELYVYTPWKSYPLFAGLKLVQDVEKTPYTDGRGLQKMLESRVMPYVVQELGDRIDPRKALLVECLSRYGMMTSFLDAGFECVFGDMMFALGLPVPIRSLKTLNFLAHLLLPIVGRMPISMIYSVGESQKEVIPKYEKYYKEATVIAGDWLYIKKHMPEDMEGKIIVTNTTTSEDVDFMKARGIRFLVTSTPSLEGRSFGTNAIEAALTAVAGKGRVLSDGEIEELIAEVDLKPHIRELT